MFIYKKKSTAVIHSTTPSMALLYPLSSVFASRLSFVLAPLFASPLSLALRNVQHRPSSLCTSLHVSMSQTFSLHDVRMEIYIRAHNTFVWLREVANDLWRMRPSADAVKSALDMCRSVMSIVNGVHSLNSATA